MATSHQLDQHAARQLHEAVNALRRAFSEGLGNVRDFPETLKASGGAVVFSHRSGACRALWQGCSCAGAWAGAPILKVNWHPVLFLFCSQQAYKELGEVLDKEAAVETSIAIRERMAQVGVTCKMGVSLGGSVKGHRHPGAHGAGVRAGPAGSALVCGGSLSSLQCQRPEGV